MHAAYSNEKEYGNSKDAYFEDYHSEKALTTLLLRMIWAAEKKV